MLLMQKWMRFRKSDLQRDRVTVHERGVTSQRYVKMYGIIELSKICHSRLPTTSREWRLITGAHIAFTTALSLKVERVANLFSNYEFQLASSYQCMIHECTVKAIMFIVTRTDRIDLMHMSVILVRQTHSQAQYLKYINAHVHHNFYTVNK